MSKTTEMPKTINRTATVEVTRTATGYVVQIDGEWHRCATFPEAVRWVKDKLNEKPQKT